MSKENNLTDFLTDVADAIREKKGTTDKINPQDFSDEIKGIKTSTSMWTGHVDVEGLKAIGWDDEDIAYYQEHGVNWMEEDDEYHKVSDDNKALYGVLTADNIQEYKDRIVYLPKIDINSADISKLFKDCFCLTAVPILDTSKVEKMEYTFSKCYNLVYIPKWNLDKTTNIMNAFESCSSLQFIDTSLSNIANYSSVFTSCNNLKHIHTYKIYPTYGRYMFIECYSMVSCPIIEASKILDFTGAFTSCYGLVDCKIENIKASVTLSKSSLLSKQSLLYTIDNEAATSAITITLHAVAYARLSTDPDIVAALANHPLVSLASA